MITRALEIRQRRQGQALAVIRVRRLAPKAAWAPLAVFLAGLLLMLGLDGLRALLARLRPNLAPRELLWSVDRALHRLWGLAYAASGALVFVWLRRIVGRGF